MRTVGREKSRAYCIVNDILRSRIVVDVYSDAPQSSDLGRELREPRVVLAFSLVGVRHGERRVEARRAPRRCELTVGNGEYGIWDQREIRAQRLPGGRREEDVCCVRGPRAHEIRRDWSFSSACVRLSKGGRGWRSGCSACEGWMARTLKHSLDELLA